MARRKRDRQDDTDGDEAECPKTTSLAHGFAG